MLTLVWHWGHTVKYLTREPCISRGRTRNSACEQGESSVSRPICAASGLSTTTNVRVPLQGANWLGPNRIRTIDFILRGLDRVIPQCVLCFRLQRRRGHGTSQESEEKHAIRQSGSSLFCSTLSFHRVYRDRVRRFNPEPCHWQCPNYCPLRCIRQRIQDAEGLGLCCVHRI